MPIPNRLAQLPGLQNAADATSAALRTSIPVSSTFQPRRRTSFNCVVLIRPFQLAVTVTVWSLFTLPATAANVPLIEPALIVTLAGMLNKLRSLDRITCAGLVAAFVKLAVHVALCHDNSVPGVQVKLDNWTGAIRFRENVCDTPAALAVTVAV